MSNNEAEVEAIELSIAHARNTIAKMEDLQKLTANKEFTSIVLEGYFKEEASRLVLLKADPSLQKEEDQRQIDKSINAIGYVRQYFNTIMQLGKMSQKAINDDIDTRDELLGEA